MLHHVYRHDGYKSFYITDPKLRHIHKANVKDRLVCHAIYRKLYPFFAKTFIADSYSCQLNKGTHKAIVCFKQFSQKASQNNTKTVWVLKCDIKKFFENIDHDVLLKILDKYVQDQETLKLLTLIIKSFAVKPNKGLPLGNLTSQLLVNIYMNEFDQFVKHKLKIKCYIRYADDFVFLSQSKEQLFIILGQVQAFLNTELKLSLHPNKVFIKTITSGVDFLGWVNFAYHSTLRTKTKYRMMRRIRQGGNEQSLQSYLGLLQHGDGFNLQQEIKNMYWLLENEI